MRVAGALLVLICALDACAETSYTYADLGLNVFDTSGTLVTSECVPMPVLLGGKFVHDYALAAGLSAHVVAVPGSADVTLGGIDDPAASHQRVSHAELVAGYAKAIPVETNAGTNFTVVLTSPCNQ
jgi:hypothetical protein